MMDITISMLTTYRGNNNVGVLLLPDSYWRWPEITNHLPHYYYCIGTIIVSSQRMNRHYWPRFKVIISETIDDILVTHFAFIRIILHYKIESIYTTQLSFIMRIVLNNGTSRFVCHRQRSLAIKNWTISYSIFNKSFLIKKFLDSFNR